MDHATAIHGDFAFGLQDKAKKQAATSRRAIARKDIAK
jgi:hypothetical protein